MGVHQIILRTYISWYVIEICALDWIGLELVSVE